MKTILIAINAKYIHSNLAVYSLNAYAENQAIIKEYTINQKTEDILIDIYREQPDLICFSCYIWNIVYVEELVKELGKLLNETLIWLGGPEVSYDGKEVLERLPEVQGIMKNEGEETFLELLSHYTLELSGKTTETSLSDIKSIIYRDSFGNIYETQNRAILDLTTIPFVYSQLEHFENKIIYYESSRGCPFSCSYCLSSIDKSLRFRDIELVKTELQFFLDNKVPQVKFVDRTFNCNQEHAIAIWTYIKDYDNGITNFHFEIAADLLTIGELRIIEQMRPGLIQLEIGVQSTNKKTIKEIQRTMNFDMVSNIVKKINEMKNTHQHLDLIVGLPYEDIESFKVSFNDVYSLGGEQLQLGFLKVLKGSLMEKRKKEYGIIHKNGPPYEVFSTNWLSYESIILLKGVESMVEIYYNTGQFTYTIRALESIFKTPFLLFEKLSQYYEQQNLDQMSHSRIVRYEILYKFILENVLNVEEVSRMRAFLIHDLYLRENMKNRPEFAGEERLSKEELRKIYDENNQQKLRKMTHIEEYDFDVEDGGKKKNTRILYDYSRRNPMNHQAEIIEL